METMYQWGVLEASAQQPVHINTNSALAECCERWAQLPMIAIDTEFQRVDTFYPIPGLIQVADDTRCYLIDPLEVSDFSPLVALFRDPCVLKVIHAGSEDLELFNHSFDVIPRPLFDTQLAAAFVGWGFTMGLQRLVEHALSVHLGKGETNSDWLKRPLSPQQERYAALDVAYLPAICLMLKSKLERLGRTEWFAEETEMVLGNVVDTDPEGHEYYRRFSQAWGLPDHKIAALRDVTRWREQEARRRDIPRNRILRNQSLLSLVQVWPKNKSDLARVDEIKQRAIREDSETILAFIANAQRSSESEPVKPIQRPLPIIWNKRLKKLKAIGREAAARLEMAPEVVLRKKDLDNLIRSRSPQGEYQLPIELSSWRKSVVGDALLNQLAQFEKSGS